MGAAAPPPRTACHNERSAHQSHTPCRNHRVGIARPAREATDASATGSAYVWRTAASHWLSSDESDGGSDGGPSVGLALSAPRYRAALLELWRRADEVSPVDVSARLVRALATDRCQVSELLDAEGEWATPTPSPPPMESAPSAYALRLGYCSTELGTPPTGTDRLRLLLPLTVSWPPDPRNRARMTPP